MFERTIPASGSRAGLSCLQHDYFGGGIPLQEFIGDACTADTTPNYNYICCRGEFSCTSQICDAIRRVLPVAGSGIGTGESDGYGGSFVHVVE